MGALREKMIEQLLAGLPCCIPGIKLSKITSTCTVLSLPRSVPRSAPLDCGTAKRSFSGKSFKRSVRGKFLDLLKQARDKGTMEAPSEGLKELRKKQWVVYAKKPFGSPQTVLDYLGRYTQRVALSNDRILKVQNGEAAFSYRDRKNKDRKKTMTLDAHEYIRRFLLHILPKGFMRIRHFGFLANRAKEHALPQCRKLLGLNPALPQLLKASAQDLLLKLTDIDLSRCPRCQKGTMIVISDLPPISSSPRWDSS